MSPRVLSSASPLLLYAQKLEGDAEVTRLEGALQSERNDLAALSEENLGLQMEAADLKRKTSERSAPLKLVHEIFPTPTGVACDYARCVSSLFVWVCIGSIVSPPPQ